MRMIDVKGLSKTYRVPEREQGLTASIKGLFHPKHREVEAVKNLDFAVSEGEMVGVIGPNGAGKTTTLKMLSGLMYPTSGKAIVAGFIPWERKHEYLAQISMVIGNKSQMFWDIPPMDSFRVIGEIYGVSKEAYQKNLDELIELLEMEAILKKPVRNLSLGERMKCELVGGLLYHPKVLFLDEPTLGLDVSMQRKFRQFLKEYNQKNGVTVLLTSHYMADVEELCRRVMLIHHGGKLFDGVLTELSEKLAPFKLIKLDLKKELDEGKVAEINAKTEVIEKNNGRLILRVARKEAANIASYCLDQLPVVDLSVENPPIEAVIDQIYQEGQV